MDHERPSEKGQDHVLVDPSFGGSGDRGGVHLCHPGLELLSEVIHDVTFLQCGVDLTADVFEGAIAEKIHGLLVDRESWVISSVGLAMMGVVLGEESTVAQTKGPTLCGFSYKAVGPIIDLL